MYTSNFWALSIFLQVFKMAPSPNFGVFLDVTHSFLTEVDISIYVGDMSPKYFFLEYLSKYVLTLEGRVISALIWDIH